MERALDWESEELVSLQALLLFLVPLSKTVHLFGIQSYCTRMGKPAFVQGPEQMINMKAFPELQILNEHK